jgi:phosphoglycerate dehydrogenase-like enzyme
LDIGLGRTKLGFNSGFKGAKGLWPELTRLPQILLTPHVSAGGEANMAGSLRQLFAGNLRRYLDGQPLLNVVDRSRGY